jgi:hypothetical protein
VIETADIAALRHELVRRFRTTTRELELAGRTIRLLMPANALTHDSPLLTLHPLRPIEASTASLSA